MKRAVLMIVWFLVSAIPSVAADKAAPVRIFVTSAGIANGLTDPNHENQDTVKDLRSSIKARSKTLALAESREDAVIVLVVQSRETAQMTAGFLWSPARDRMVRVKFIYGEFETELSGSAQGGTLASGGAWGAAAGKVISQVEKWVAENRAQLPADGRGRATRDAILR